MTETSAARAARFRALLQDGELREGLDDIKRDLTAEFFGCQTEAEALNVWRAARIMGRLEAFMLSAEKSDLTALRRMKLPTS